MRNMYSRRPDSIAVRIRPCGLFGGAVASIVIFLSVSGNAAMAEDPVVVVEELTKANWDRLAPKGKEVDAIYGDIVLQNAHLRAVIAKPVATRNANMTVGNVGGCLIDLTTREHESDQLSAFYPARRAFAFAEKPVMIVSTFLANADGTTAGLPTRGVRVSSPGTESMPAFATSYSLSPQDAWLNIESKWTNTTNADITLKPEDDLRADAGSEDMPKVEDGTHELFWFHDIYWQQAYGIRASGFRIRCNSNPRESERTTRRRPPQPAGA